MTMTHMQQLRELEEKMANTQTGPEYWMLHAQREAILRTAQTRTLKPIAEKR